MSDDFRGANDTLSLEQVKGKTLTAGDYYLPVKRSRYTARVMNAVLAANHTFTGRQNKVNALITVAGDNLANAE